MTGREWYEKHGVTPNADGWVDGVPQCKNLPLDNEKWLANIAANMQLDVPNAQSRPYNPRTMVMVCGGVTAKDYLEKIRAKAISPEYDVFCSNKTGEWLLQNGIVPQYHLILDAKKSKVKDVQVTHPDVTYLLAVHCDPAVFHALRDRNVQRFFCPSNLGGEDLDGKELNKYLTGPMLMICGGTMAGVRAITLAEALGYRNLEYYGFDACLASKTEHYAYDKTHNEAILEVKAEDGRIFLSTHVFADQVRQVMEWRVMLPCVKITVHGDSFMSHMLKLDDVKRQRKHKLRVTPEYLELQRQMHAIGGYGISGHKHAKTIHSLASQLTQKYGSVSVLDYGCGQSTLKKAMDALPPIHNLEWREYDPSIEGKDAEPESADLVVCSDVMEHIEKDCILNVLDHIESLTNKLVFFWIATQEAVKTLPDGRNAHISIKLPGWWHRQVNARFVISESYAYEGAVAFVGMAIGAMKAGYAETERIYEAKTERIYEAKFGETIARFMIVNEMTKFRAKTLFTKEPVTIDWINRMKSGETLFDIGANVGSYSIWAGCNGIRVFAFEPASQNYDLLCRNIVVNNLAEKVTAYCAALSNEARLDKLYLATNTPGGSCNEFGEAIGHTLEPRVTPHIQGCVGLKLDQLVESGQLPQADHIKIDVDGFEHKVIAGATNTLKNVKSILVEVNENLEPHLAMVKSICDAGFEFKSHQVDQARRQSGPFKGCAEYLFTRTRDEIDDVIDRIMEAPLDNEPFPHLYMRNVFSPEFYADLLGHLEVEFKPIGEVRPIKGYAERSVHAPMNGFWGGVDKLLRDGRLKSAICAKLGRYDPSFKDETLLIQDRTGYNLGPHTDTIKKVASLLFYLPADDKLSGSGTSVYRPKIEGFTCDGSRHHLAENFDLIKTMPYVPNSLFAFAKSNKSFHGVEPFMQAGTRNALLYDIRI